MDKIFDVLLESIDSDGGTAAKRSIKDQPRTKLIDPTVHEIIPHRRTLPRRNHENLSGVSYLPSHMARVRESKPLSTVLVPEAIKCRITLTNKGFSLVNAPVDLQLHPYYSREPPLFALLSF